MRPHADVPVPLRIGVASDSSTIGSVDHISSAIAVSIDFVRGHVTRDDAILNLLLNSDGAMLSVGLLHDFIRGGRRKGGSANCGNDGQICGAGVGGSNTA